MFEDLSELNIVRVGDHITFDSLKYLGVKIIDSFPDNIIKDFSVFHYKSPVLEDIDAYLLTMILNAEYGGQHTLGITAADLKTNDKDEFYNTVLGGKNPENNVAVVSTKKLSPIETMSEEDPDLYIDRILKVSLHEIGHNFGLTDHTYQTTHDGCFCPMSRGEFNRFGYVGYVRAIVDNRGFNFCNECIDFLRKRRIRV